MSQVMLTAAFVWSTLLWVLLPFKTGHVWLGMGGIFAVWFYVILWAAMIGSEWPPGPNDNVLKAALCFVGSALLVPVAVAAMVIADMGLV